ncbi:MAG: flagellar export protein FliJ [Bdellovibrionota bacterium]|mgnify:CR=1 FL=1
MRFLFSLESLLDHRRRLEEVAQKEWAEAQGKVDAAVAQLGRYYDQVDEARTRSAAIETQGGAQTGALISIDEFIGGQKYRIEAQRAVIRELKTEAERLQEILIEAAKETKTLEKLKERQLADFNVKRRKAEAKANDELIVTRFKRAE